AEGVPLACWPWTTSPRIAIPPTSKTSPILTLMGRNMPFLMFGLLTKVPLAPDVTCLRREAACLSLKPRGYPGWSLSSCPDKPRCQASGCRHWRLSRPMGSRNKDGTTQLNPSDYTRARDATAKVTDKATSGRVTCSSGEFHPERSAVPKIRHRAWHGGCRALSRRHPALSQAKAAHEGLCGDKSDRQTLTLR